MSTHQHHRFDYIEIATADIGRAKQFYADTFGWAFNDYGPDYAGIQGTSPDQEVGGLTRMSTPSRGGPLVVLYSDDLDATAVAVTAGGGVVTAEPYEFPGARRFQFLDPSGNELGVWAEH